MNLIDHVKENEIQIRLWIEMNENIQPSHDIISPIIPFFQKEFPKITLIGCGECLIDMLRWSIIQAYPKTKTDDTTTQPTDLSTSTNGDIQN